MLLHPPDAPLTARLDAVSRAWGGAFEVVPTPDWRRAVRAFDGSVVHLTMYGLPLERVLPRLRRARHLLVVVGGAKVPPELYRLSSVNVAVGHEPHSEVAAVAVLLERLLGVPGPVGAGAAPRRVLPRARGKRVVETRRKP
jgi:tRNA (cytidine56-2'-O)-methyltransferase